MGRTETAMFERNREHKERGKVCEACEICSMLHGPGGHVHSLRTVMQGPKPSVVGLTIGFVHILMRETDRGRGPFVCLPIKHIVLGF